MSERRRTIAEHAATVLRARASRETLTITSAVTKMSAMDLLTLVAEPSRREILSFLWSGERSAGDVAERMPVTFGAVSQHLRVLREAGVLEVRKDGRRRLYRVRREALGPLASVLEEMWTGNLRRLKATAEFEEKRHARKRRSR